MFAAKRLNENLVIPENTKVYKSEGFNHIHKKEIKSDEFFTPSKFSTKTVESKSSSSVVLKLISAQNSVDNQKPPVTIVQV